MTLHGVTESTPPSNYVKDVLAKQFEEKTGIKVELETTSWTRCTHKAIKDMEAKTGIYDMVYIEQDIVYAYLQRNFLTDITKTLADKPDLKAPEFDEKNFTTFADYFRGTNNDLFGVPMEAFIKVYLYRKDLFDDPKIKEAFKARPARTSRPPRRTRTTLRSPSSSPNTARRTAAALGHDVPGPYRPPRLLVRVCRVGRPDLRRLQLGHQRRRQLRRHGRARRLDEQRQGQGRAEVLPAPARHRAAGIGRQHLVGGRHDVRRRRAAQGLVYGENAAWIASDQSKSKVVGKVGIALPPLSDGVMADAESGKGYIGYYDGGAFGVPVTAKNQDAALLFLQFIGQNSVQPDWAVAAPRITNTATYDDPKVKEMDTTLGGYYTMLKNDGKLFAGAPKYPFHAQVRETVAPIFYRILTGEVGPDEGLDEMAAATEEELTSLGYRK